MKEIRISIFIQKLAYIASWVSINSSFDAEYDGQGPNDLSEGPWKVQNVHFFRSRASWASMNSSLDAEYDGLGLDDLGTTRTSMEGPKCPFFGSMTT
jgi:hypothetical protein